jgi:hypothetical protein
MRTLLLASSFSLVLGGLAEAQVALGEDTKQPYDISVMKGAMSLALGKIVSRYPGAKETSKTDKLWSISSRSFTYAYQWDGVPTICVVARANLLDPASPTPEKQEVLCGRISFEGLASDIGKSPPSARVTRAGSGARLARCYKRGE